MGWIRDTFTEIKGALSGDLRRENQALMAAAADADRQFQQQSAREAMQFEADQAALNREFQLQSAREAMRFEADQAALNREYQADMSNSAYQRAVADLQKAGLNPVLAAMNSGASTPAGSAASGYTVSGGAASGYKASGSRANVDTTSNAYNLVSLVVNSAMDMYKTNSTNATNMIKAVLGVVSE